MSDTEETTRSELSSATLLKTRTYLRARITRIHNKVSNTLTFESLSNAKKDEYRQTIKH